MLLLRRPVDPSIRRLDEGMSEPTQQGMPGMLSKAVTPLSLLIALVLSGCASEPILTYESEAPAQVLSPIQAAGVDDGRARFREVFCERFDAIGSPPDGKPGCSDYLHALSDEPAPVKQAARSPIALASVRFVVVPGFMGDAAPGGMRALGTSIDRLAGKGYRIEYIQVSGGGGGDYNAEEIAAYFRNRAFPENEKLVMLGYSKGIIDLMHFLVNNPEFAENVDGLVSYAGAVNGSALAEAFPQVMIDVAIFLGGSDPGDNAGFRALKPSVQLPWLAAHPLPDHIAYFSLAAFTDRDNVSGVLVDGYDRLAQINPKNDGQLIFYDQILPGSTLLGYVNGDHWAVALPFTEKASGMASTVVTRNVFPRDAMLEAVLLYVRENL
jgi:hypothetical protein